MKKFRNTLARFRLLGSVLALALMLSALAVTPARAEICDNICSGWTAQLGCTNCNYCCYDNGVTVCKPKSDRDCGTGGPGLLD